MEGLWGSESQDLVFIPLPSSVQVTSDIDRQEIWLHALKREK